MSEAFFIWNMSPIVGLASSQDTIVEVLKACFKQIRLGFSKQGHVQLGFGLSAGLPYLPVDPDSEPPQLNQSIICITK